MTTLNNDEALELWAYRTMRQLHVALEDEEPEERDRLVNALRASDFTLAIAGADIIVRVAGRDLVRVRREV